MFKRRLLLLTLSLVLAFTILTGQIASVAYADNGNHGKKYTEDSKKEDKLEKHLKPLLNVKVKNGEVIFKNGLVNKGWKDDVSLDNLYYKIKVYPYNDKKTVLYTDQQKLDIKSRSTFSLRPGRVKGLDNFFEISTSIWKLKTRGKTAPYGKYKAVAEWYKGNDKEPFASVSKTFMIHEKDIKGSKPSPAPMPVPQEKSDVYVNLSTTKVNGRLNLGIALVNGSNDDINFVFGSTKQYDIIIRDSFKNIVYDTRTLMSAQRITEITVDADETYYLPKYEWNYTDKDGKKVKAGKYNVEVIVTAANSRELAKKYDLDLDSDTTVNVTDNDIKYDIDAVVDAEVLDRQLKLDFTIRNRTSRDATLQFRSGQPYTIKLLDKNGKEVYQYPTDSVTIQSIIPVELKANSTLRYGPETINLSEIGLVPGEYTVKAEFLVWNILDNNGNEIKAGLYNLTAAETLVLTELDVNKYVGVETDPYVTKGNLVIPLTLKNLSDEYLSLKFKRPNYSIRIYDGNKKEVFTLDGGSTYAADQVVGLGGDDYLDFGAVTWSLKDKYGWPVTGDITIEVKIKAAMMNINSKYESELTTVQKFHIAK